MQYLPKLPRRTTQQQKHFLSRRIQTVIPLNQVHQRIPRAYGGHIGASQLAQKLTLRFHVKNRSFSEFLAEQMTIFRRAPVENRGLICNTIMCVF